MSLVLRPCTRDDVPILWSVIDAICAESSYMATNRFEPTLMWLHALAELACDCHLLLVACHDARPVGWCRLFPETPGLASATVNLGIGLLAACRHRGWGTNMVREAQRWAGDREVGMITLTTHQENIPALHLFRKCGFQLVGQDRAFQLCMQWTNPVRQREAVSAHTVEHSI